MNFLILITMDMKLIEPTEDEKSELMITWLKKPVIMNKKKAILLISDLEETIIDLRKSVSSKETRMQKNMVYNQILNRETVIKYAKTFI